MKKSAGWHTRPLLIFRRRRGWQRVVLFLPVIRHVPPVEIPPLSARMRRRTHLSFFIPTLHLSFFGPRLVAAGIDEAAVFSGPVNFEQISSLARPVPSIRLVFPCSSGCLLSVRAR